jgi:hypothetical protein
MQRLMTLVYRLGAAHARSAPICTVDVWMRLCVHGEPPRSCVCQVRRDVIASARDRLAKGLGLAYLAYCR